MKNIPSKSKSKSVEKCGFYVNLSVSIQWTLVILNYASQYYTEKAEFVNITVFAITSINEKQ